MKQEDMFLIAAAALGVFMLSKMMKKGSTVASSSGTSSNLQPWVYEVARADGYVYYSDGTVINPDGAYYKYGDVVYQPAGMYQ